MPTCAGVLQCVATAMMLADVVLFRTLMGHGGSCAPLERQCSLYADSS